jgi:hypothetical protein
LETDLAPAAVAHDTTRRWVPLDGVIAVALAVSAFIVRLGALPKAGLFHDDAWSTASITMASFGDWFRFTVDHPAYNLLLFPLRPWAVDHPAVLIWPALVFGALLPAVVYAFLRDADARRSTATVLSAAVVAAPAAIAVSAHVKTYALDAVIVTVLAALLPRLARRRWSTGFAAGWIIGACVVGAISVFALIATAVAGLLLLTHSHGDRAVRFIALAVQGVLQCIALLVLLSMYDDAELNAFWRERGGYIDFGGNPVRLVSRLWDHFRGVIEAYPGTRGLLLTLLAVGALIGLVAAACRVNNITGHFLLALGVVSALGALRDVLPFGVTGSAYLERLSVWLLPAIAYGLAELARLAFRVVRDFSVLRTAGDLALYVVAVAVVVPAFGNAPAYPISGSSRATQYVDATRSSRDLVILLPRSAYAYAIATNAPVRLVEDQHSEFGSGLRFGDVVMAYEGGSLPRDFADRLRRADRVFVFLGVPSRRAPQRTAPVVFGLAAGGFVPGERRQFGDVTVTTWTRK